MLEVYSYVKNEGSTIETNLRFEGSILNTENFKLTQEINRLDDLSFTIREGQMRPHNIFGSMSFKFKNIIKTDFGFFEIMELNENYNGSERITDLNLRQYLFGLRGIYLKTTGAGEEKLSAMVTFDDDINAIMSELTKYTRWTFTMDVYPQGNVKFEFENNSIYNLIYALADQLGYEVVFDTINEVIKFTKASVNVSQAYFQRDLNLLSFNRYFDIYQYANRVYPIGADDLTISSINGSLSYVGKKDIGEDIRPVIFSDDRFTVQQNLLTEANKILNGMAPYETITCSIVDLSKHNSYGFMKFKLGDYVRIIDPTLDAIDSDNKNMYRVISMVSYPNDKGVTEVTLNNNKLDISVQIDEVQAKVGQLELKSCECECCCCDDEIGPCNDIREEDVNSGEFYFEGENDYYKTSVGEYCANLKPEMNVNSVVVTQNGLNKLNMINSKPNLNIRFKTYSSGEDSILDLTNFNTSLIEDSSEMFDNCDMDKVIYKNLNLKSSRNLNGMFRGSFGSLLNLSGINASNAETTKDMFMFANFDSIDLSGLTSENIVNMSGMFSSITTNTKVLDLSSLKTTNVEDMYGMFQGGIELNDLNLSHFNISKIKNIESMFFAANIRNLHLFSGTLRTGIKNMFNGSNVPIIDMSGISIDMNNLYDGGSDNNDYAFKDSSATKILLPNLICSENNINVINNRINRSMFEGCLNLEEISGGPLSISAKMFKDTPNLKGQIDLSKTKITSRSNLVYENNPFTNCGADSILVKDVDSRSIVEDLTHIPVIVKS